MAEITIELATAPRFGDAEHAITGGGDGRTCQCQWWTITNVEFQKLSTKERTALFRAEVSAGPPPGLIAYVDGEAAGWVRVGPRTRQVRLGRTRNLASSSREPWDDEMVWAVTCFAVRTAHRGQGLTAHLLAAAVEYARENGARLIEGYPLDPAAGGRRKSSNDLYHGMVSTFAAAGFVEVARPRPDLAVMALDVAA